jgi:hypothetical protein
VQAAIMSEQKGDPLSVKEMQKEIEALKAKNSALEAKNSANEAKNSALEAVEAKNSALEAKNFAESAEAALHRGKFFSPWTSVWTVETVRKDECKGAFKKMRRDENFMVYKGILNGVSKIETMNDFRPEKTERKSNKKNRKFRPTLTGTGISSKHDLSSVASSRSESARKSSKGNRKFRSASTGTSISSKHDLSSVASSLSESVKTSASNRSLSMQYPDFSGQLPSTRAHMIPDPNTSDCHNYYNAICQAVVGCPVRDTKLLARRLATESEYNLLRAPYLHENYFDHKPCWILVPACPLPNILKWKTEDTYPVLAVACGCGGTTKEEAYQMMCSRMYNDTYDDTNDDTMYLKRSKCKEEEFVQATNNLREMTLAMAETLVGNKESTSIQPYAILNGKEDVNKMSENDYELISKKLKDKTADEEKGGEKSPGTEGSDYVHSPRAYDEVQFAETRKSLQKGIKLPKALEGPDPTSGAELLQFVVDPKRLDLYPDPMLLLIKAAVNWSWWCGQKLDQEELVVPSTPVPTMIEFDVPLVLDVVLSGSEHL